MSQSYDKLAQVIVDNVGGKENVLSLTNCITRLRFKLKDESKANDAVLNATDGVVTVMKAGGQYQVVIGNHVPDVRQAVDAVLGKLEVDDSPATGSLFNRFVDIISGIFQPILPPLSAAGMLKGLAAVIVAILGASFKDTSTYAVLNAMGDGLFLLLPMFVGYTAMVKFKGSPFLGMMIASSFVYKGFIDGSLTAQFKGHLDFFGIPFSLPTPGYGSSVMPIIAAVAFAAFLEKNLRKVIPDVVKLFLTPFFTALIAIPVSLLVIGPAMNVVQSGLETVLLGIQGFSPILFGLVLGAIWQVLVMFGLHWAIVPLAIMTVAKGEPTQLLIAASPLSFAQTGAVIAIMLKTKNLKLKELCVPAIISGICGVTEPAIYGITLPKKRPFWMTCGVGAVIGACALGLGIKAYQMAGLGIFSFTGVITPDGDLKYMFYSMGLCTLAIVLGFLAVYFTGFDDSDATTEALSKDQAKALTMGKKVAPEVGQLVNILAPLVGTTKALSEVEDQVFSSGVMGKGLAIQPEGPGEIIAPFAGQVASIFPHALGLVSDEGVELLIHVGLDTVQLEGKHFEPLVQQGDRVNQGDLLLKFDTKAIEAAGFQTIVPVVVTNSNHYTDMQMTDKSEVTLSDIVITVEG